MRSAALRIYWCRYIPFVRAEMATKAKEFFDKMREEEIPENITDNMLGAKQKFIEMYSQYDTKSLSLRSMLENIKIFSK